MNNRSEETGTRNLAHNVGGRVLGHPDDIARDPGMTIEEKRAVLAAWASDAHAVENAPALRLLEDGSVVPVDEILRALASLDRRAERDAARRAGASRRLTLLSRFRRVGLHDDDDDPPPCPASAAIPVRLTRLEARAAA